MPQGQGLLGSGLFLLIKINKYSKYYEYVLDITSTMCDNKDTRFRETRRVDGARETAASSRK